MTNSETLKPLARLRYGVAEHEHEYMFTIRPDEHSNPDNIPREWERRLTQMLGVTWTVRSRGTRIEAFPPNWQRTAETDQQIKAAILSLITDKYNFIATAFINERPQEF